ncbi:hypothetical protein J437_LFUL018201 [Ladona fulva]|uniref:DDE Tnp4 domain-containing protein n=1 Tax=Ladona fulva TaxID=123851 RepID=A0A8K0KQE5_LADFU|nr:hypothetical protein J437_LFUL018201 [Ladona fulva]
METEEKRCKREDRCDDTYPKALKEQRREMSKAMPWMKKDNHVSRFCPRANEAKGKGTVVCFICREFEHIASYCPKVQKKGPSCSRTNPRIREARASVGEQEDGEVDQARTSLVRVKALMVAGGGAEKETMKWFVDSGASEHMTPHREILTNFDGLYKGCVELELKDKNGGWLVKLERVLYVPELQDNLISLRQIDFVAQSAEWGSFRRRRGEGREGQRREKVLAEVLEDERLPAKKWTGDGVPANGRKRPPRNAVGGMYEVECSWYGTNDDGDRDAEEELIAARSRVALCRETRGFGILSHCQILSFQKMAFYCQFSSSEEDLEALLDSDKVTKNENYFEETVPKFSDQQYMEHFRVSRRVSQELANKFEASEYYNYQSCSSPKISALKFICIFLWFAGNEAVSFRVVSDRFNISKSSLHKIIRRVTYFLSNLSPEVITWPKDQEKVLIEQYFREKQFPGVVGVIDGTHVRIDRPSEDPDSYLNRKHFYSIQAQVVCDHRINLVLRASPLYNSLAEKCQGLFILGDSGYPCLPHLLTPFKDFGQLSRRQRNYNYLSSKNQYIIEHTFGLLKQKFRLLYHLKIRKIHDAVHFIRACAVLHNLSIEDEVNVEEPEPIPAENANLEKELHIQDDGDEKKNRSDE